MNCCLCSGIALWIVGKRGYCAAHKEQAWAAAKSENKLIESERAVGEFLPDGYFESQKRKRAEENGWR